MSITSEINCKPPEPMGRSEKTIGGAEDESDGAPERSSMEHYGCETEIVSNETAGYNEPQTGIKVSYILKENEIYKCLKQAGTIRVGSRTFIFVNIALIIFSAVFLISGIAFKQNMYYFYTALCAVLLMIFGFLPLRTNHIRAKSGAGGRKTLMKIYPEYIQIGRDAEKRKIPLDGTAESVKIEDVIAIFIKEGKGQQMVLLPLRCIEKVVLPEVQAIIFAGTKHRKIKK